MYECVNPNVRFLSSNSHVTALAQISWTRSLLYGYLSTSEYKTTVGPEKAVADQQNILVMSTYYLSKPNAVMIIVNTIRLMILISNGHNSVVVILLGTSSSTSIYQCNFIVSRKLYLQGCKVRTICFGIRTSSKLVQC